MDSKSVGKLSVVALVGIMVVLIVVAISYDIWVYHAYGVEGTISRGWQSIGYQWPSLSSLGWFLDL